MEVTEEALVKARELISLIQNGNCVEAETQLIKFNGQKNAKFVLIRMLISYSQENTDKAVGEFAIRLFERFKSKAPVDEMFYYDIANGYQTMYEIATEDSPAAAYTEEAKLKSAIKYFEKAGNHPTVLTNLGNLYDYIGRPVEAIRLYDKALRIDTEFGMAMGNKALALENLASVTGYQNVYLIKAYQLYTHALERKESVCEIGGERSVMLFEQAADRIFAAFDKAGKSSMLDTDLTHPHDASAEDSKMVSDYKMFCYSHELYLNLHMSDKYVPASVGDELFPILHTKTGTDEERYVEDIAFRFNEISEAFMSARLALFQSQTKTNEFSEISQQTALINTLDYAASNIYVGYLKMAFKEAYNVLDKIAVLINHYLELENDENAVYFSNVWFEGADDKGVVSEKILRERYLVGLFLLSRDLKGSKQSNLRNALTHRYVRVYRGFSGPKGTYTFEELTESTIELLYLVRCAITYLSTFITRKERVKSTPGDNLIVTMPLSSSQNLDIWY